MQESKTTNVVIFPKGGVRIVDHLNPKPNYIGRNIARLRHEKGWTVDEYYLKIAASAPDTTEMVAYNTVIRAMHLPNAWNPREKTLDVLARPFGLPGWVLRIEDAGEFERVRRMLLREQEPREQQEEPEIGPGDFLSHPLRGHTHKL